MQKVKYANGKYERVHIERPSHSKNSVSMQYFSLKESQTPGKDITKIKGVQPIKVDFREGRDLFSKRITFLHKTAKTRSEERDNGPSSVRNFSPKHKKINSIY